MIREERDPAFWAWVLSSPEVQAGAHCGPEAAQAMTDPRFVPLASENGGYIFASMDRLGRSWELHSMFRPEGWGKEALLTAKEAFTLMFSRGAQIIITASTDDNPRSRPPKTFRFEPAGDMAPTADGNQQTWFLTQRAWQDSPARRSM